MFLWIAAIYSDCLMRNCNFPVCRWIFILIFRFNRVWSPTVFYLCKVSHFYDIIYQLFTNNRYVIYLWERGSACTHIRPVVKAVSVFSRYHVEFEETREIFKESLWPLSDHVFANSYSKQKCDVIGRLVVLSQILQRSRESVEARCGEDYILSAEAYLIYSLVPYRYTLEALPCSFTCFRREVFFCRTIGSIFTRKLTAWCIWRALVGSSVF